MSALNNIFLYQPIIALKLLRGLGSAEELFNLNPRELSLVLGIRSEYIAKILDKREIERAEKEIEWAERSGIEILTIDDELYPFRLKECEDAPLILYYKGTAGLNKKRVVSIVGTRSATDYGKLQCVKIVKSLAELEEKPLIISGLAYGIDITAHLAALEYGLETVAVMATGLDRIYPSLHRNYAAKIVKNGGVISEYPSGIDPVGFNFLKRNRIIAGMADAVFLIESKIKGGGMNTVSIANSYSREIYALPGKVTDEKSSGCNYLISNNIAQSIYSTKEIANQLGWSEKKRKKRGQEAKINFDEQNPVKKEIIKLLAKKNTPLDFDEISDSTGISIQQTMAALLEMEMEERVIATGRKYLLAVDN